MRSFLPSQEQRLLALARVPCHPRPLEGQQAGGRGLAAQGLQGRLRRGIRLDANEEEAATSAPATATTTTTLSPAHRELHLLLSLQGDIFHPLRDARDMRKGRLASLSSYAHEMASLAADDQRGKERPVHASEPIKRCSFRPRPAARAWCGPIPTTKTGREVGFPRAEAPSESIRSH